MKKELIITKDSSHSLFVPTLNETYHSKNGAITESMHIFIKNGIQYHLKNNLAILEVGFGTGLNTVLTLENSKNKTVNYTTLEPHPITKSIYSNLNYYSFTKSDKNTFLKIHTSNWEEEIELSKNFTLFKSKKKYKILYLKKNMILYILMHLLLINNQICGNKISLKSAFIYLTKMGF